LAIFGTFEEIVHSMEQSQKTYDSFLDDRPVEEYKALMLVIYLVLVFLGFCELGPRFYLLPKTEIPIGQ
jgi:hypothetical protein